MGSYAFWSTFETFAALLAFIPVAVTVYRHHQATMDRRCATAIGRPVGTRRKTQVRRRRHHWFRKMTPAERRQMHMEINVKEREAGIIETVWDDEPAEIETPTPALTQSQRTLVNRIFLRNGISASEAAVIALTEKLSQHEVSLAKATMAQKRLAHMQTKAGYHEHGYEDWLCGCNHCGESIRRYKGGYVHH